MHRYADIQPMFFYTLEPQQKISVCKIALIMQLNARAAESTMFTTALSLISFMALITYLNLFTDHLGTGHAHNTNQYKNGF